MIRNILKTSSAAVLLLAGTTVFAHNVSLDGDVEVEGGGYWKTGDGVAVTSGSGCIRSGTFSDDNRIGACEGDAPAEEPKAEPKEEPAPVAEPVKKTISLNGAALFDTDSDQLSGDGEAAMAELVETLQGYEEISGIEVVGHADNRGSVEYNQDLSERRANTVAAYLGGAFGSAPINASGMGELSPIASNGTAEGRAQNRRVEVGVTAIRVE